MPGMSGSELIDKARARRPRLRIVLATGYAELPAGAPTVPRLAKPYTYAQLEASVAEAMKTPVAVP
jgi:FixJ family two-component response regulator